MRQFIYILKCISLISHSLRTSGWSHLTRRFHISHCFHYPLLALPCEYHAIFMNICNCKTFDIMQHVACRTPQGHHPRAWRYWAIQECPTKYAIYRLYALFNIWYLKCPNALVQTVEVTEHSHLLSASDTEDKIDPLSTIDEDSVLQTVFNVYVALSLIVLSSNRSPGGLIDSTPGIRSSAPLLITFLLSLGGWVRSSSLQRTS